MKIVVTKPESPRPIIEIQTKKESPRLEPQPDSNKLQPPKETHKLQSLKEKYPETKFEKVNEKVKEKPKESGIKSVYSNALLLIAALILLFNGGMHLLEKYSGYLLFKDFKSSQ